MISNIVVIGCGSIGKRHIRNFLTLGIQSVVAVDADSSRRTEVSAELGITVYPTFKTAAASGIDLVVIAVPNIFHKPMLEEAIALGAHVFMEKPLAASSEGVVQLLETMDHQGLKGFLGSNWKFHPSLLRMKQILASGALGRVFAGRIICGQYLPDWHPWEDYRQMYSAKKALGGGVLLDSHELDYTTWLLGPASMVACMAGKVSDLEIETEDLASILLKMTSGAVVHVQLDYLQRAYHRSYEFAGSEGTLRWSFAEHKVSLYKAATGQWSEWPEPSDYQINDMYLEQARNVLDVLDGRTIASTSLWDGLRVLRLIEAACLSSQTKSFVRLEP